MTCCCTNTVGYLGAESVGIVRYDLFCNYFVRLENVPCRRGIFSKPLAVSRCLHAIGSSVLPINRTPRRMHDYLGPRLVESAVSPERLFFVGHGFAV